jgi:hypothetical protein
MIGEIWETRARYKQDTSEIQARYMQDTSEIQARYTQDTHNDSCTGFVNRITGGARGDNVDAVC